jgi:hypothetical protein
MNPERIKLIIHNMELLVQSLKNELEDSSDCKYESVVSYIEDDVDEYYYEEEE